MIFRSDEEVGRGKYNYCPQPEGRIDLPKSESNKENRVCSQPEAQGKSAILSIEDVM